MNRDVGTKSFFSVVTVENPIRTLLLVEFGGTVSVVQFDMHIQLEPALDGVMSELWAIFVDPATGQDVAFDTGLPMPVSAGGSIDGGITVGVPTSYRFILVIPEQTSGGMTVLATQSAEWLGTATVVNQVLPITVVSPPIPGVGNLGLIVVGAIALLMLSQR